MRFAIAVAVLAATAMLADSAFADTVKVPEGTELPMEMEQGISSKSAQEGDRFTVSLSDDVKLSDGTVLRAGYRGVGEVIDARKSGMLGKTGKLAVRLVYLRIGDQRIKLRASRDIQGSHNTGAQIGTFLLLWPAAPFIKGKSTEMKRGTMMTAFADEDSVLQLPLEPPPREP